MLASVSTVLAGAYVTISTGAIVLVGDIRHPPATYLCKSNNPFLKQQKVFK
jgi:hypothetical protein